MMIFQLSFLDKIFARFSRILAVSCLIALFVSPFALGSGVNINSGDWIQYIVTDSSESENMFYGAWPPGKFYGNWTVNKGDEVWFNVTSISSTSINGTLKLGSYLFSDVRNIDAASALALSIYPWLGGFFADVSNWNKIFEDVSGTNTTLSSNVSYMHVVNGKNCVFSVNIFNTTNYYGQISLFYYDSKTGLLLAGFTSFGNYKLGLKLVATSLLTEEVTTTAKLSNVIFLLLTLIVPAMNRVKHKKN